MTAVDIDHHRRPVSAATTPARRRLLEGQRNGRGVARLAVVRAELRAVTNDDHDTAG
jgi:hypothetical protein